MIILAIESSCDETAVAILRYKGQTFSVLANVVSSQVAIHAKFGGVIPEVAARMHIENILPIIDQALDQANINLKKIDFLAVTNGPGLMSSLLVGLETAKALSLALKIPLIPVNHLEGHLFSAVKKSFSEIKLPAVGLIVSGGHTQIIEVKKMGKYQIIGETRDDAVGEAFDKVAKILNLGYPGGPAISQVAKEVKENHGFAINLPRPMIESKNLEMSFSGIKTAVLYLWQKYEKILSGSELERFKKAVAYEFQKAVVEVLVSKTVSAIENTKAKTFLLGGGVSANSYLRTELNRDILEKFPKCRILIPEISLTGDNAVMIAMAGIVKIKEQKKMDPTKLKADPNLDF